MSGVRIAAATLAAVLVAASAAPQWLRYPTPGTPRLPDGTPNLSAPAPRAADGRPDLTGVWDVIGDLVMPTDGRIRSKYVYNIGVDLPGGTAPFQPWARDVWNARQKVLGVGAPSEKCLPHGIPDAMLTRTLPFKMIQTAGVTIILFEEFNNWRQVFTDGRPLPVDPEPAWLGYSIGRWDKDEFVIETAGFNDKSWLDAGGTPHTEALRTTERFRRHDFGHMDVEFTFDDPKTFTRKWSTTVKFILQPDTDLLENQCENNRWNPAAGSRWAGRLVRRRNTWLPCFPARSCSRRSVAAPFELSASQRQAFAPGRAHHSPGAGTCGQLDSRWFDVAAFSTLWAVLTVVFGRFEQHKPAWRRLAKFAALLACSWC